MTTMAPLYKNRQYVRKLEGPTRNNSVHLYFIPVYITVLCYVPTRQQVNDLFILVSHEDH
jgi:hypothetical protein